MKLKCFYLVLKRPALLLAPCWSRKVPRSPSLIQIDQKGSRRVPWPSRFPRRLPSAFEESSGGKGGLARLSAPPLLKLRGEALTFHSAGALCSRGLVKATRGPGRKQQQPLGQ